MSTSTTLPLYWNLSSANKAERLDASATLISALQQFQDGFKQSHPAREDESSSGGEENDSDEFERYSENLDQNNATDVAYAIRRLIRGLASARDSSRLGFAVALTEVCAKSPFEMPPTHILYLKASHKTRDSDEPSGSLLAKECIPNFRWHVRARRTGCPFRSPLWLEGYHQLWIGLPCKASQLLFHVTKQS